MAATDIDVLESRVTRLEEALRAMERRMTAFDHTPRSDGVPPAVEEEQTPPLIDFVLVGRSVLVVGGAYLLRALTEIGVLPQSAGVVLALVYAIVWIAIADRALARGRRTAALFDASTAAMIAGSLLWEAAARFHMLTPTIASVLTCVVAMVLLAVAVRRQSTAIALVAAAASTFTLVGLAIGTSAVLPPAIAAAAIGVAALRLRTASHVTLVFAGLSDFLALAVMAMALLDRVPRPAAGLALACIGVLWVVAIETRPRWPEAVQTAAALMICGGGASFLAFDAFALSVGWSLAAVATAAAGRWRDRSLWSAQAPFWALAATIAAFTVEPRAVPLLIVGTLAIAALSLTSIEASLSRLTLLGIIVLIALVGADAWLTSADRGVLAMERSVVLAVAAVLLSLLGVRFPEAVIAARIVLVCAGLKLMIEDVRIGRAATVVVALAAYGTAMVIIARHRKKENV